MVEPDLDVDEHVSDLAMDLLDELRWTLSECLLVLKLLAAEADLNFTDLQKDLISAQLDAKEAYQASSLIHQRAELDERWGGSTSRPKAVFARHNAAVRAGAPQIHPRAAISDGFERHLWQLPRTDRNQDFSGKRPRCTGSVRATGQPCASVAIYLGAGNFAAHCYSHATPAERDEHRLHDATVEAQQSTAHQRLRDIQRSLGEAISGIWLQRYLNRRDELEHRGRVPAKEH
ncbi:hypothetical protein A5669_05100 [Mycolicibacterium fortuitum]|uniref:hypothetical protein n=1 Tax=Mycolicibacterium fortuitum TaxID=1766 RepID=UPI0007EA9A51|nr:hypothetical protein [Mycolicibacterium fortuitum]OBG47695.1 hypothetical protein A5669_05100 [Mycolicibacterium fortuitum]